MSPDRVPLAERGGDAPHAVWSDALVVTTPSAFLLGAAPFAGLKPWGTRDRHLCASLLLEQSFALLGKFKTFLSEINAADSTRIAEFAALLLP